MRYKRGSKVEVFCKEELPSGSWRCAEVICGNGHYYSIRCGIGAKDEENFERVSRKLIRPRPPVVRISGSWMPGDVVEVLHDYSWKMATVIKVLRGNHFLVRQVGTLNEFKVRNCDVRLRQSWTDGKWVVVGKGFGIYGDQKCSEQLSFDYNRKSGSFKGISAKLDSHEEKDYFGAENNIDFQESGVVSKKILKRVSHNFFPQAKAPVSTQKCRAIEKDGRCHRVVVVDPSPLPEKAENCAYSKKGEIQRWSLLNYRTTKFSETDEKGLRMKNITRYSCPTSLERNDTDDVASSVGSCSIVWDNPSKCTPRILAFSVESAEDHSSDAESVCPLNIEEENYLRPNEEELAAEIHRALLKASTSCLALEVMLDLPPFS